MDCKDQDGNYRVQDDDSYRQAGTEKMRDGETGIKEFYLLAHT
jgi:hypothetical protein